VRRLIGAAFAGALLCLAGLFGARRGGVAAERAREDRARLEDYRTTRQRIDDAEAEAADDPAPLRDWLRARGRPDRTE
jgi:hypothetical protein